MYWVNDYSNGYLFLNAQKNENNRIQNKDLELL